MSIGGYAALSDASTGADVQAVVADAPHPIIARRGKSRTRLCMGFADKVSIRGTIAPI
jgi:hypothetical protein